MIIRLRILPLFISLLLFSCQSEPKTATEKETQTEAQEPVSKASSPTPWGSMSIEEQQLNKMILQGLGGFLIKSVQLKDSVATLDYASKISETNISTSDDQLSPDDYWTSANRIEKIFPLSTANLFNTLAFLSELRMSIPYQGRLHQMSISRKDYESFAGKSTAEIKGNQQRFFNSRFINSKQGRKKFLDQFVEVQ